MAMVGWAGAGMEVVDGMYVGRSQGGWSHMGRWQRISRLRVDSMIPDHTVVQVRSGRGGIGQSFWKGLSTGRHEKARVRCPCRRLATLHGAQRPEV